MGIFDKILGKEQKVEKKAEKTEVVKVEKAARGGDSISTTEIESPKEVKKKPVVKPVKPVKPKKEVAKRKVSKKDANIAHKILFENLISEKSTMLAGQNKYVFRVDSKAGKYQIKEAIEGYYGVQVIGVNTIKIHPKKRIHGRTIGWKKGFKKAVITLREGDTIAAVEGV